MWLSIITQNNQICEYNYSYSCYYFNDKIYTELDEIEKEIGNTVYVITYCNSNITITKLVYERHLVSGRIQSHYKSYSESILTKEDYDFIIQKLNK